MVLLDFLPYPHHLFTLLLPLTLPHNRTQHHPLPPSHPTRSPYRIWIILLLLRRVQDQTQTHLLPLFSASIRLPDLRIRRRREVSPANSPGSLPSEQPRFGNVHVIEKANLVTYRGPTMVANTLHAAAVLLREGAEWDWFINLSATDYPLMSQDDLLHVFSHLPRDLNFIDHTSNIGWKASQRAKPVIIDPGLYLNKKSDVFWITQRRSIPTAFKLFTGSAWMALSRPFIDYCIWGWDNLPRTVLMYYSNFLSSPEGYFHTVLCNAEEFKNTTVNSDLHFITWDNPPKQHPHHLTLADMDRMVNSNAPFARKFRREDPVLDTIDEELLNRGSGMPTPGGWCIGSHENGTDPCAVIGDINVIRPGQGARRLETLVASLLSTENFRPKQCK
ncbi:Beta-glucuronosyltransferase GlcAT14A [Hirschfeldia incana]|nr:Beta-glucuronosyltransferase GlcAT14A [Hirschfeldia incana]